MDRAALAASVKVTFEFITSTTAHCCAAAGAREGFVDFDAAEHASDVTPTVPRRAVLRVFDYDAGCTRVFGVTFPGDAVMAAVYEALPNATGASTGDVVCFAPAPTTGDHALCVASLRVLATCDAVPGLFFCQKAAALRRSVAAAFQWVVVHLLVCDCDGSLSTGHVPVVVPVAAAPAAAEQVRIGIAALFDMGVECREVLRECQVVGCSVEGKTILLREPCDDGPVPRHVAVLFSAVDVGDVVLVSEPCRRPVLATRRTVVQAVVVRRRVEDGLVLCDVQEVDTDAPLDGLSCVQLVPL